MAFALLYAMATHGVASTRELLRRGLHLTVLGDNDFYSQEEQVRRFVCLKFVFRVTFGWLVIKTKTQLKAKNLPYSVESLRALPKHAPCLAPGGLSALKKTGRNFSP